MDGIATLRKKEELKGIRGKILSGSKGGISYETFETCYIIFLLNPQYLPFKQSSV